MLPSGPAGAVFFDVDGTLVPETSSSLFLAGFLGHRDELAEAEDDYAAGHVDNRHVSELDAAGWAGASEEQIRGWLDGLPLVAGIAETVAWCHQHMFVPVLTTLAWSPVGSYLADRFGFHAYCGPRLEAVDGHYTGRVAVHFDEYDKRDFALAQAGVLEVDTRACAAIGDSRSDLPLFASVGLSVAFNASAGARKAAAITVDADDLRAVLPFLGRLNASAVLRQALEGGRPGVDLAPR
jgi:phosphoserine phosphatase